MTKLAFSALVFILTLLSLFFQIAAAPLPYCIGKFLVESDCPNELFN